MNDKQTSKSSGFENIGKFYLYISEQKDLKPIHRDVFMLMVRYSFGYMKNIKFEIEISTRYIADKLNCSHQTAMRALAHLINLKLIERVKWQNFGPKQRYKYKIKFPKDFHIAIKEKNTEESMDENLINIL